MSNITDETFKKVLNSALASSRTARRAVSAHNGVMDEIQRKLIEAGVDRAIVYDVMTAGEFRYLELMSGE